MKNLELQRFGRLVAVAANGKCAQGAVWFCKCDCGRTTSAVAASLLRGRTRSCGCLRSDTTTAKNRTHGLSHSKAYECWAKLRSRCLNPKDAAFAKYGGRGITVCAAWESFETFHADMGDPPTFAHSIDRIDNERGYSPDNCRWANDFEQANNTRRNHYVTRGEVTMTLAEWCRALGVPFGAVRQRISRGMPVEEALTTHFRSPPAKKKQCKPPAGA